MTPPLDPLPRRRLLRWGGGSILAGAVLTACGGHGKRTPPGPSTTTSTSTTTTSTTFPILRNPGRAVDALILRTASSLEHYAVGVYTEAAGLDVVGNGVVLELIKFLADHHSLHASVFEGATGRTGARPFTEPNQALRRVAAQQLGRLRSPQEVLEFAYGVETLLASTYAANAGEFADVSLNAVVAGVGAVEARHVAVLGTQLAGVASSSSSWPAFPGDGLQPLTAAVAPGLGV